MICLRLRSDATPTSTEQGVAYAHAVVSALIRHGDRWKLGRFFAVSVALPLSAKTIHKARPSR